jgi:proteasome lid subunit RPN8/RPN11
MTFSIRKIIRAFAAPKHELSCPSDVWKEGVAELRRRTEGWHESGAFLLGTSDGQRKRVEKFVYYDDLDPNSLSTGIVVFDGVGYGPLWDMCRNEKLRVVADVHVHPLEARQSESDRTNPMIARKGHIALIAPNLAKSECPPRELGVYRYQGDYRWSLQTGRKAEEFFYIGFWG